MAYYYSPFRNSYKKATSLCPFCDNGLMQSQGIKTSSGVLLENEYYRWVVNWYPKFEGHTLLVPKTHRVSLDEIESPAELHARAELLRTGQRALRELYPESGIEVFLQTGMGSESSVEHLHWHIVPAQTSDPLRGFSKLGHFFTTNPTEEKVLLFPVSITLAQEQLQKALAAVLE